MTGSQAGRAPPLALLGVSGADPYLRLMRFLELATKDPRLRAVVLKVEGMGDVDWGQAEELRQAVLRLRSSGKKVMAVLLSCDDKCYFVASSADQIYALPESSLLINGLSASVTTLGGTMEKLGVTWDVARVGDYKTAPEQLTRTEMSEPQRETINAYLDTQVAWYEEAVTHRPQAARGAAARGVGRGADPRPRRPRRWGCWTASSRTSRSWSRRCASWRPGRPTPRATRRATERERHWGTRRRIAIVPVLGTIAGGKSREDPLGPRASPARRRWCWRCSGRSWIRRWWPSSCGWTRAAETCSPRI